MRALAGHLPDAADQVAASGGEQAHDIQIQWHLGRGAWPPTCRAKLASRAAGLAGLSRAKQSLGFPSPRFHRRMLRRARGVGGYCGIFLLRFAALRKRRASQHSTRCVESISATHSHYPTLHPRSRPTLAAVRSATTPLRPQAMRLSGCMRECVELPGGRSSRQPRARLKPHSCKPADLSAPVACTT